MVPPRVRYRVLVHGLTCLQLRWRFYSFRHSKRLVKVCVSNLCMSNFCFRGCFTLGTG